MHIKLYFSILNLAILNLIKFILIIQQQLNLDQILQERIRDNNGKSSYKKNQKGESIIGKEKKGVPLSDVWEIPYLNPKAKERKGYPTQKTSLIIK